MGLPCRECLVCVVDGDAACRSSLSAQLRAAGLTVCAFDSAEAFLESQEHTQADCLILELNLPGMGGLALQRCLNQRQRALPLIFMASSADVASAVTALQNGAVDFLRKEADCSPLVARVCRLVAAIRTGRAEPRRHPYAPSPGAGRQGRLAPASRSTVCRSLPQHVG
ncbi:MAG: response regulator transcription factor [Azonexus sp.]